ncbi:hypothetical protein V1460_30635 [Streptomyces sp. SCSIO 30461]|uniref:hypothetical protein n=1 Tax=Streptomyces sp. SCSIO 30461 TaxID=3118085 RepID=UPI0030D5103A
MEPREVWERNTILAKAFCASDDKVRAARAALDEAQADRTRKLAAFAVIVGDDGSVAGMMGLHEREVRVARRTVGRDGARTVAANLLTTGQDTIRDAIADPVPEASCATPPVEPAPVAPPPPPSAAPSVPAPAPASFTSAVPSASATVTTASIPVVPAPASMPTPVFDDHWSEAHQPTVLWTSAMDSVLVWSWQSGVDLMVVANELGVDLRTVLQRVQILAADGHLAKPDLPGTRTTLGRHRRYEEDLEFAGAVSGVGDLYPPPSWT